jgi:hypothetical protein
MNRALTKVVLCWKIFGAEWSDTFREIFVSSPPVCSRCNNGISRVETEKLQQNTKKINKERMGVCNFQTGSSRHLSGANKQCSFLLFQETQPLYITSRPRCKTFSKRLAVCRERTQYPV